MNKLATVRSKTACAEVAYNAIPPYAQPVLNEFVSSNRIIHLPTFPVTMDYRFAGFQDAERGSWYVIGGATPNFKVDAGFIRPRPPKGRRFKEWKELQKAGKIVVSPRSVGSVIVRDQPVIESGTPDRTYSAPCYSPKMLSKAVVAHEPCRNKSEMAFSMVEGNYYFGNMYDLGVTGTYSIMGKYQRFTNATLSTLLTMYRPDVERAVAAIESTYAGCPHSSDLFTAAASELNESVFDITTEVAELPSLIGSIIEMLKKALLFYRETRQKVKLLKRNPKTVADLPAEIAKLWMTYRYGVQPIAYSVVDALNQLEMSGVLYRTVRRGQAHALPLACTGWSFASPLNVTERAWGKGRFAAASNINGLGLNPFVSAWELIPLSFVVDWFLNVGDVISALVPSVDFEERQFTRSTRCQQTIIGTHIASGTQVPFAINLYDCYSVNPIDLIGLNFDALLSIKQKLDGLSLVWLMFVEGYRKSLRS